MNSSRIAASRMRKEYGEDIIHICDNCCNCQLKKRGEKMRICIAYSDSDEWNGNERACKLWNTPFRAITPAIKQVGENYKKKPKHAVRTPMQISFF